MKKLLTLLLATTFLITGLSATHKEKSDKKYDYSLAHDVRTEWYMGILAHRAHYQIGNLQVVVSTVIDDVTGMCEIGAQYIVVNGEITTWQNKFKTETVNGTKYKVANYEDIKVYTHKNEQFIIIK